MQDLTGSRSINTAMCPRSYVLAVTPCLHPSFSFDSDGEGPRNSNPGGVEVGRPMIMEENLLVPSLCRPAASLAFLSPRRKILEFLHPLQMAGTETVAQLLGQELLLRRRRDQLDASDAFGFGVDLGRRTKSKRGHCSAWVFIIHLSCCAH